MKEVRPFTHKELLAAGLVLLNVLVLTPCAWVAGYLWDENQAFQRTTEQELRKLRTDLTVLKSDTALQFVLKETFQEYCNRVNDRLNTVGK